MTLLLPCALAPVVDGITAPLTAFEALEPLLRLSGGTTARGNTFYGSILEFIY